MFHSCNTVYKPIHVLTVYSYTCNTGVYSIYTLHVQKCRKIMFDHTENVTDFLNMMSEENFIFLVSNANVAIICANTLCKKKVHPI